MTEELRQLGYHYYPDDLHYSQADLATWLPILRSLGARWLTLTSSAHRAIPEHFLKSLIDAGITPVVRLPVRIGTLVEGYSDLLSLYARWGVQYVVVFDRPNCQSSWRQNEWTRIRLIERFTDFLIPVLQAQRTAGLKAIFPPLEPGGDYWDTAFLEAALSALQRRAPDQIKQLVLSVYAWTYNQQLDWGIGGPENWPESLPYHTPEGSQDQRGLRIFDWYSAIYKKIIGEIPSFLVAAGGSSLPTAEPTRVDLDRHSEDTLSITRLLQNKTLPGNLLNFSFYCLASSTPGTDSAWFPSISEPLPVVKAMQTLLHSTQNKQASAVPQEIPVKPIVHYVLLPRDLDAGSLWDWKSFGDFIRTAHPVIGFSAEEARYAERVTVVGDETQFPSVIEDSLRAESCIVSRLDLAPFSDLVSESEPEVQTSEQSGERYG
ncbi:MAG: hypothetical protein JXA25_02965 [Anaerolineales bacterium]|nr:hypothetical protein [Anaerolineales bacterium]